MSQTALLLLGFRCVALFYCNNSIQLVPFLFEYYLDLELYCFKPKLMNDLKSKKTISRLKGLGIYQIIGGAIGVLLIFWGFLNNNQVNGPLVMIYLFMVLFFGYSIICGVMCLRTNNNSLKLSLINQILQVIGFAMAGFAFQYAAGIYLTVGLDLTESFNFTFGVGLSKINFNFNNEPQRLEVNFNFIALGLIIFIERTKKLVKEEQDKNLISSLL